MCAPPKKNYVCPPICNCFLRAWTHYLFLPSYEQMYLLFYTYILFTQSCRRCLKLASCNYDFNISHGIWQNSEAEQLIPNFDLFYSRTQYTRSEFYSSILFAFANTNSNLNTIATLFQITSRLLLHNLNKSLLKE